MSSNTELTLDFILPDETTAQKLGSALQVVLGAGVTDPDLGLLLVNEYVEYDIETGFLSQSGTWTVQLTYTDTAPIPNDVFIGLAASFTVSPL